MGWKFGTALPFNLQSSADESVKRSRVASLDVFFDSGHFQLARIHLKLLLCLLIGFQVIVD
ncbi:MAG: hypothetical protein ACI8UO_003603 [Verrucomicrobiales bacterium]|jgi:hypothetical protein